MTDHPAEIEWFDAGPRFGSAHPHGCCTAKVGNTACGYPRRADGTCTNFGGGHPAPPDWKKDWR